MINTNSFRFGEISRKQAGRFLEEGYNQGSFQFRNARTMYDSGMSRRYPVRTELEVDDGIRIYCIHSFGVTDSEQFVIGIGTKTVGEETHDVIVIYEWYINDGNPHLRKYSAGYEISSSSIGAIDSSEDTSNPFIFTRQTTNGGNLEEVELNERICRGIRFAQYYNRLYIVSHEFRTIYLELNGTAFSAHVATFIMNSDAKDKLYYIVHKNGDSTSDISRGVLLFKGADGNYYRDINYTEQFIPDAGTEIRKADQAYVADFEQFPDGDDFNTKVDTYPSVVAVINGCLYFANTISKPSTIWKSRVIGSSQWLLNYSSDSMHDFSEFEVVATSQTSLKDSDEWPTEDSGFYVSENGVDAWFVPQGQRYMAKVFNDSTGTWGYEERVAGEFDVSLYRTKQYWVTTGYDNLYYTEAPNPNDSSNPLFSQYTWTYETKDRRPKLKEGKYYGEGDVELIAAPQKEEYPFSLADAYDNRRLLHATDYEWETKDGASYSVIGQDGKPDPARYPVKKPYKTYKMDNADELYEETTAVNLVATASCGLRTELNTGMDDAVMFISSGCEKIIVGTTCAEWTLPATFCAVEHEEASNYSSYGSLDVEPIKINKSFFYLQSGNILRELYLYQSYMQTADVTALNHDVIDGKVVDAIGIGTPDPCIFLVKEDGGIVYIMYDRDGGLSSIARWYSGTGDRHPFMFKSMAASRYAGENIAVCLVSKGDGLFLCKFDYDTTDYCDIVGTRIEDGVKVPDRIPFETLVETVYAEINGQDIIFGRSKKAKALWLRPYECGHISVGNDIRMLTKSNYALGNNDYYFPITGKSDRNFSIFLRSVGAEPMNILALSWEVDNGN